MASRLADELPADEYDARGQEPGAGKVSGAGIHPGNLWGGEVEETVVDNCLGRMKR